MNNGFLAYGLLYKHNDSAKGLSYRNYVEACETYYSVGTKHNAGG